MDIRPERSQDVDRIRALLLACFPTSAEADLVEALRTAGHLTVSLVAEAGELLVGHIAFSPVTVVPGHVGLGLAPLAVLPAWRGQGVGAALVEQGVETARRMGCEWIVVLGEPEYYRRFGFESAAAGGLHDEYGGGDAFQVLELIPDTLPKGAGLVRYAPEFGLVG